MLCTGVSSPTSVEPENDDVKLHEQRSRVSSTIADIPEEPEAHPCDSKERDVPLFPVIAESRISDCAVDEFVAVAMAHCNVLPDVALNYLKSCKWGIKVALRKLELCVEKSTWTAEEVLKVCGTYEERFDPNVCAPLLPRHTYKEVVEFHYYLMRSGKKIVPKTRVRAAALAKCLKVSSYFASLDHPPCPSFLHGHVVMQRDCQNCYKNRARPTVVVPATPLCAACWYYVERYREFRPVIRKLKPKYDFTLVDEYFVISEGVYVMAKGRARAVVKRKATLEAKKALKSLKLQEQQSGEKFSEADDNNNMSMSEDSMSSSAGSISASPTPPPSSISHAGFENNKWPCS